MTGETVGNILFTIWACSMVILSFYSLTKDYRDDV